MRLITRSPYSTISLWVRRSRLTSTPVGFIAMILLVTVSTSSCTSMHPIRSASAPIAPKEYLEIKPGDRVAVEMADGRRARFRVQRVDSDALIADNGERYVRAEMRQLSRQRFSHAKTWSLVGGIGFGVFLALAVAVASAVDDLLSGRM